MTVPMTTTEPTAASTANDDLTVYKVSYDPQGKPVVIPVAVQSRGKGRLYITDKRVNGCKDVDYINYAVRDADDGATIVLQSVLFSLTGEAALAHWLEQAQRDILQARSTVAVLERAFMTLGRDGDGRLLAPTGRVAAGTVAKPKTKPKTKAAPAAPAVAPPRSKPKTRKQA